jgi:hypothetical protein
MSAGDRVRPRGQRLPGEIEAALGERIPNTKPQRRTRTTVHHSHPAPALPVGFGRPPPARSRAARAVPRHAPPGLARARGHPTRRRVQTLEEGTAGGGYHGRWCHPGGGPSDAEGGPTPRAKPAGAEATASLRVISSHSPRSAENKTRVFASAKTLEKNPGGILLSHRVPPAVPSALESLTSVFGMGTGVASPALPPGKNKKKREALGVLRTRRVWDFANEDLTYHHLPARPGPAGVVSCWTCATPVRRLRRTVGMTSSSRSESKI